MERRDPEPPLGVHARGVGVDLREAAEDTVMLQDGLDEEGVGVAHHLQITPAAYTYHHQDPTTGRVGNQEHTGKSASVHTLMPTRSGWRRGRARRAVRS